MYNIIHISFHHLSTPHGLTRAHKWPTSNVSGFIAQLVKASNRCRNSQLRRSQPFLPDLWSITHFEQSARIEKIPSIFWPVLQYDAPVSGTLTKFFFYKSSANQGVRIWLTVTSLCKVWTVVIGTPLHGLLSWRLCTHCQMWKFVGWPR